jgi:hypothetical protein
METALLDVFEQARKVVEDADRKIAEEEERRREAERTKLVELLSARIEEAFDFTSKEKLELEPRYDVLDGAGVVEFVIRSMRAIFLLSATESNRWTLRVVEDGHKPLLLCEFQGGTKGDQVSQRLAAARIVTMIGNWVQNATGPQVVPATKPPARWQDRIELKNEGRNEARNESRPEPTYGTMGKFLGC